MVRTIQLNDGKAIPALAWGNGTGGIQKTEDKAIRLGKEALGAGILHIDTAQMYYTEREAGIAVRESGLDRKDVWVTTKISDATNVKSNLEDIRRSVKESLDKIGFIPDLLLIHNPFVPEKGKGAVFWQALESLVEDGTLKGTSLGVSNYRPQDLQEVLEVAKIKPAVNQLEFHPYVLAHLEPVLAIMKQHDIVVESFGGLSPVLRHKTGGPLKPVLQRIAKRLSEEAGWEVDEAVVLLQWTIQWGAVAVTTSTNPKNIEKMAKSEKLGKLTEEEMKEIETVGRTVHFRSYTEHMTTDFPNPDLPDGQ